MVELTYICKRTVVSTKPVQPGKYYPLSVLDRLMEPNHLRMVYYYRSLKGREPGELIGMLRESLSEMLTCYPIVTGRLTKDHEGQWTVKCNDAGVRMVEARAKGSVEDWLRSVDRDKELKLVHWEDMYHKPYFWSTFYVQLTEFEDCGIAIGFSCIHLLADPVCATMFIKAWADITLTGAMSAPPFFHPLPPRRPGNMNPNHEPYTQIIDHYKSFSSIRNSAPLVSNSKNVTITLLFTDPMVRACMAMAGVTEADGSRPSSPFAALCGLFWVCLSKVKGKIDDLLNMSVCLDMRKVLRLDKGFFGNCMVYNKVHAEQRTVADAARAIGEVVAEMDNEGIVDLIEWLNSNDHCCPPLMNCCDLICSSLEGSMDPYATMFEEGFSPSRVSCYVEPVLGAAQVLILPSPPREGPTSRMVMVTLPEEEMVKLNQDDLLQQFSPVKLMGCISDKI